MDLPIIIAESRKMAGSLVGFIKRRTSIYLPRSALLKIILEDIRPGHWNLEHFPCPANVEIAITGQKKKRLLL